MCFTASNKIKSKQDIQNKITAKTNQIISTLKKKKIEYNIRNKTRIAKNRLQRWNLRDIENDRKVMCSE